MSTTTGPVRKEIAEVLDRVKEILPQIAEAAAAGEQERRVSPGIVEALQRTGAMSACRPQRYGGPEASLREMLEISSAVGRADGGTAWMLMLANVGSWLASLLPQEAQKEIFGDNPDVIVTGVLAPTGSAAREDGGYRVSGKWFYNSGSWYTDWAIVGFPILDEQGNLVNQAVGFLPRAEYEIEETWFVAGMKASASNAIIATDVYIPDHRLIFLPPAIEGTYPSETAAQEPAHRAGFVPVLAAVLLGPTLGVAEAALDYVASRAASKSVAYTFFQSQQESTTVQVEIARAAQLIDACRALLFDVADRVDQWAADGHYPDFVERARIRGNTGFVAEQLPRAVEQLTVAHGSASYADSSPLQRYWRDVKVGASHAVVNPLVGYETHGIVLVGAEKQITPLV